MSHKSHAWERSATSWRAHSTEEHLTDDLVEFKSLVVIEAVCVDDLSHHFKGWLSTELLFDWHIEIINED